MADKIRDSIKDLIDDMELRREQSAGEGGYDERISGLIDDLYGQTTEGFKYEPETDPNYQAAVKDYEREADRTMRDVLAQGAARTGGIASTSAVAAASQARDYKMSGLADEKAKLYNAAYARNQQEVEAKYQLLSTLENLQDEERNNYVNLLAMMENMDSADKSEAQKQIQTMISLGMTPGADLMEIAGWDNEYVKAMSDSMFNSMDNAELQQYLATKGYNLAADGIWGPDSEAAFKKEFGRSSGRTATQEAMFNSMTVAQMQQYLNSKGYNLDVDGVWGSKTEAAYKKVFGKASGRQGTGSSSSSTKSSTKNTNPTPIKDPTPAMSYSQVAADIESINSRSERGAAINELYAAGIITKEQKDNLMIKYTR